MRDQRTEAAILEVARGGILRRGIAVSRAQVALITNISADHFGEYGIEDLDGLADVKLSVAGILGPGGLLILNADDPVLQAKANTLAERFGTGPASGRGADRVDTVPRLAWFALDADHPTLRNHRAHGGATCGVRAGQLVLSQDVDHDLGSVISMPLTVDGFADYNIANLAGAALAAASLGISPVNIAKVYARFGADPSDNAGRMMRFDVKGARVLVDYAHNPDGLAGLLKVAKKLCADQGRLGLIIGHAGNRQNADIEALARVAAETHPDLVVIKENEAFLRGRPPGEIPRIIHDELMRSGLPATAILTGASEIESVRMALDWARPGDVLALPIHGSAARVEVLALLAAELENAATSDVERP
jgi:UDP-N-acetylmuramyl tripeptide synthase